jgi:hypothetical protein
MEQNLPSTEINPIGNKHSTSACACPAGLFDPRTITYFPESPDISHPILIESFEKIHKSSRISLQFLAILQMDPIRQTCRPSNQK